MWEGCGGSPNSTHKNTPDRLDKSHSALAEGRLIKKVKVSKCWESISKFSVLLTSSSRQLSLGQHNKSASVQKMLYKNSTDCSVELAEVNACGISVGVSSGSVVNPNKTL